MMSSCLFKWSCHLLAVSKRYTYLCLGLPFLALQRYQAIFGYQYDAIGHEDSKELTVVRHVV